MARTTSTLVQELLGSNYGVLPDGTDPSLQPYIDTATSVVDRVVVCAASKGITISDATLELIERWLAAHYYTKMDPTYQSKNTAGAGASFVRDPQVPEPYKNGAIDLDYTGCLNAILNKARAGAAWLGKVPSERIPYDQRS